MHFIFPHRIARLSYFVRNVALTALAAAIAPLFETGTSADTAAAIFAVLLFILYWGAFVVAPRCRDSGMSPWSALLLLVPGVNVFLGGYLTWKRSWPVSDGLNLSSTPASPSSLGLAPNRTDGASTAKSESLRRLEALRDEGVLTEQDLLRRKARLEKNG